MACRDAQQTKRIQERKAEEIRQTEKKPAAEPLRLMFGVDSKEKASTVLQNNLTQFEWVVRNKLYPNFWGRNINGENCLSQEEIDFLHGKGCKIAAIVQSSGIKETEEQGKIEAKKAAIAALQLNIGEKAAIFLEIDEKEAAAAEFLKGYARGLLTEGYTPGFKVNTDANYSFDREYSRGKQSAAEVFEQCVIWALTPSLEDYERVTTTHRIHPDVWRPYAPSGTKRKDIGIWQYGKNCHPIEDEEGKETVFNVNLVKKEEIILDKMF